MRSRFRLGLATTMAIDTRRRQLLLGLPAAWMLSHTNMAGAVAGVQGALPPRVLTCWSDLSDPSYGARAGLSSAPETALAMPARGHEILWHPSGDGSAIVVARRPGTFLLRFSVAEGRALARFETDDDLRFEGHIAFSADGRRLYATETDLISGGGQVGVYDPATLERLAAWPSGGIGPHALRFLADGRLAVANGGILTLPETGRMKLNIDRMDPSLSLLDATSGTLLTQHRLPDRFMSVRHIAQHHSGQVAVALQNEGDAPRPLLALLDGSRLRYADAQAPLLAACGGYAGDIVALPQGFALSCTHAGVTALWRADGTPLAHFPTPRVCALAIGADGVIASGDRGDLWALDAQQGGVQRWQFPRAFDNHAVLAAG